MNKQNRNRLTDTDSILNVAGKEVFVEMGGKVERINRYK